MTTGWGLSNIRVKAWLPEALWGKEDKTTAISFFPHSHEFPKAHPMKWLPQ